MYYIYIYLCQLSISLPASPCSFARDCCGRFLRKLVWRRSQDTSFQFLLWLLFGCRVLDISRQLIVSFSDHDDEGIPSFIFPEVRLFRVGMHFKYFQLIFKAYFECPWSCQENILFINVVSCPEGLKAMAKKVGETWQCCVATCRCKTI